MSIGPLPRAEPFTDEDARPLAELLARYATQELDQFGAWRVQTPNGPQFIFLAGELPPGWMGAESLQTFWPLRPRLRQLL